jgi:hypothetical protein
MFIVPAYKETNQVSRGRGKGGLVTMWKKSLTKYVSKVKCNNFRLQATKFSFPNCPILIINGYFPCDPRTANFNDSELVTVLADLKAVIRESHCQDIFLAADLNCHFQRQSRFSEMVRESFIEMGLTVVWQNPDSNPQHLIEHIDFTHCSVVRGIASYSTIDHFVTSQRVYSVISEAGVIHSGENTSNHSAIYAKLRVGELDFSLETPSPTPRVSWNKANTDAQDKYKTVLSEKLNTIPLPAGLNCRDVHCNEHSEGLEVYTMNVGVKCRTFATSARPLV